MDEAKYAVSSKASCFETRGSLFSSFYKLPPQRRCVSLGWGYRPIRLAYREGLGR